VNTSVLRHWKAELKALGFAYTNRMFMYEVSESPFLHHGMSIQKNVRDSSSKINPTVLLSNHLLDGSRPEVLVLGNLRPEGIYLHVARSSWWPEDALPDALNALKTYARPWFQTVGRIAYLAAIAETAIREERQIIDVMEPVPESETALPWGPSPSRRLGWMRFYQSAILHDLNGDRHKAIRRTKDWLNALPATDQAERTRALTQLEKLTSG
jgi:hypothetical protein